MHTGIKLCKKIYDLFSESEENLRYIFFFYVSLFFRITIVEWMKKKKTREYVAASVTLLRSFLMLDSNRSNQQQSDPPYSLSPFFLDLYIQCIVCAITVLLEV